jgi:hypothetical protein
MGRQKHGDEYAALTPGQVAALAEFDRAINDAPGADVPNLVVPAVLGSRYGGGLRLRGCSRSQLRALLELKKAQEWTLGHDAHAARAYLRLEERDSPVVLTTSLSRLDRPS